MMASELVRHLQDQMREHGDQGVVSGLDRTGYGEPVEDVVYVHENLKDVDGKSVKVFDLNLYEGSSCAIGGF